VEIIYKNNKGKKYIDGSIGRGEVGCGGGGGGWGGGGGGGCPCYFFL